MPQQLATLLYPFNKYPRETRRYWRVLSKREVFRAGAVQDLGARDDCQATAAGPAKGSKAQTRGKGCWGKKD